MTSGGSGSRGKPWVGVIVGLGLMAAAGLAGWWTSSGVPPTAPGLAVCRHVAMPDVVRLELAATADQAKQFLQSVKASLRHSCGNQLLHEGIRRDSLFIVTYVATLGWWC